MNTTRPALRLLLALTCCALRAQTPIADAPAAPRAARAALAAAVDAWLDDRFSATPPDAVLATMAENQLGPADLEQVLRAGRATYPTPPQRPGKLTTGIPLPCDHVDHETEYFVYVPTTYDRSTAHPLLLVCHGGSADRDLRFGAQAARSGLKPFWIEQAEQRGWLLVAPLTDRGWMWIGNSILFSALSKVQRDYHVDPDRVYLTGHSMGGHMTWRSAFQFPDRFAAVSPMSGGYDYVKSQDVMNLFDVPGYATFGTDEPYQINEFNHIIGDWLAQHRWAWINQEKKGPHTIFVDEVPKVADFFAAHPRDLYRPHVFARMGRQPMAFDTAEKRETWHQDHVWNKDRPIPACTVHWLRCTPREAAATGDDRVQTIDARNAGANRFEITSRNARTLRLYLHPKMVDFGKPVVVTVNGAKVFDAVVEPSPKTMLELVKEFDDRGRVFWAAIDVAVTTDRDVEPPTLDAATPR